MASAAVPCGSSPFKMKTGFSVFRDEQKPGLLKSLGQYQFADAEIEELLWEDWETLSAKQQEIYSKKAKEHNGKNRGYRFLQKDLEAEKATAELKRNRKLVCKMFNKKDWMSNPIVVCSFSTYFKPDKDVNEKYTPAEIGMTAVSLKNGVIDNFGRIIDPDDRIPPARKLEATARVNELGIPAIGIHEDFKNYIGLMIAIQGFLQKHCSRAEGEPFYVFVFNPDLEMTTKSFQWIFRAAGFTFDLKVLDLNLYAHLASTVNNLHLREISAEEVALMENGQASKEKENVSETLRHARLFPPSTSTNRKVGQPLNKYFIYPYSHPMTQYGVFPYERDVDPAIRNNDNYKYHDELCCIYHMTRNTGSQFCSLLNSNRSAFSLLEILTMSNQVDIIPGNHFPSVKEAERQRRWKMLSRWGITELEHKMWEDEEAVLKENAEKKCNQLNHGRILDETQREEADQRKVDKGKRRKWREME